MDTSFGQHRGVAINATTSGQFYALINGKRKTAPTIQSIKNQIDKSKTFTAFSALTLRYDAIKIVNIVGVKHVSRSFGSGYLAYIDETGQHYTTHTLFENTPENRKRIVAIQKLKDLQYKEKEALSARHSKYLMAEENKVVRVPDPK